MRFIKYTNQGPRKSNEDSYYVEEHANVMYACVADGVGGLRHGAFASNYVMTEFQKHFLKTKEPNLTDFLKSVNSKLIEISKLKFDSAKIGTTFTGAIISHNYLKGIHVGDSRLCVLRGNGIKQLTIEHNEVGRLIREGIINPLEKQFYPRKNIIESILGSEELFDLQEFEFELQINDRILFSTDGFHESISKMELRDISIKTKSLEEFKRKLIIELENRILHDNTTFICIEI